MTRAHHVLALFPDLAEAELVTWIAHRWVRPQPVLEDKQDWVFHQIDVARVRLIYDLRREMDVAEDTVPLVLSLLDQVYELRDRMKALTQALQTQPPEIRTSILQALSGEKK